jgi:uncharacterized protein
VPADDARAFRWYRLAAENGDAYAQNYIAVFYEIGRGVAPDLAAAARWYRAAADQGDGWAQANLGNLYLDGRGVERDEGKALQLFQASAAQGNPAGRADLGYMYSEGVGVGVDHAKALELFRQAAADGDARAMAWLGYYHEAGLAVAQSDAEALRWYRAAAEGGNDYAPFALGEMYREGRGVARDWQLARRWYQVAMARGNANVEARRTMVEMLSYAVSDDVALSKAMRAYERDDFAAAFAQFQPLAVAGDAVAQRYLGEFYRSGRGIDADPVRALMWLSLAAQRLPAGVERERALADRDAVARQLTGVQLTEAERRAREWTPSAS